MWWQILWKYTTYGRPSQLFFDLAKDATKRFKIEEEGAEEKTVDGLFVFKQDVEPKCEDPANQKGCSVSCDLYNLTAAQVDQLWHDLLFALVGQNFPFSDCVNGFRLLDRMKKHKFVKFDLWMSSGVGSYKLGTPEYAENKRIVDAIIAYAHGLINRTQPISIYSLTTKDHFIASKIN